MELGQIFFAVAYLFVGGIKIEWTAAETRQTVRATAISNRSFDRPPGRRGQRVAECGFFWKPGRGLTNGRATAGDELTNSAPIRRSLIPTRAFQPSSLLVGTRCLKTKADRHAVECVHVGDDGGQIHDLPLIEAMPQGCECVV
jgi:hypothetical protein